MNPEGSFKRKTRDVHRRQNSRGKILNSQTNTSLSWNQDLSSRNTVEEGGDRAMVGKGGGQRHGGGGDRDTVVEGEDITVLL